MILVIKMLKYEILKNDTTTIDAVTLTYDPF